MTDRFDWSFRIELYNNGNTWVDLALNLQTLLHIQKMEGKNTGCERKNFRKFEITQKLDF